VIHGESSRYTMDRATSPGVPSLPSGCRARSAAKAGLLQVMRVLALAGAVRQIRANAVLPGVVATDMLDAPRHLGGGQDQVAALRALHPLGRLGTPGDVARSIVYLLDSPWITGTELVVDGGLLIHP